MERAFLVTKDSNYYKDVQKYVGMVQKQKQQVADFEKSVDIEANEYAVTGDGGCNCPFDEFDKSEIRFYIVPTKKDKTKFQKQLLKPMLNGLSQFRRNGKISREFQQYCVDNKVIINILQPDLIDYLKSIDWAGYTRQMIECDEGYYLKVTSELLKEYDNPKGFIPIPMSEFYKKLEEKNNK